MTVRPTVTVTLLFTDVVRSTSQWEQYPAEMGEALTVHDAIVRAVVAAHGGRVFATSGDGFCVAFSSPSDGVAAAAEAQRRLAAQRWPGVVEVRVRMGVHTGEVEERDGDYFGPSVNRAARLMATAHGGQVVVSEVTAELSCDRLPAGVDLVDLGRHRLKDLSRPEHVFQLDVGGLPAVFPPLRSLDAVATNLPVWRTSFVGRVGEVQELQALIGAGRLVTVTGPGGSGKTRLAAEVGRRLLGGFPDGVWFVDLSAIVDGDLVDRAVAGAMGLAPADGRSVLARLLGAVGEWRCLVVIDNCEQVLDATAEVVEALLGSCDDVKVLATSRELLGLDGEQVWRVPELGLSGDVDAPSEAVLLFIDRARLADAGFGSAGRHHDLIEVICRRLDGLPLAIELAAARVAGLGVDEVAGRLDDMLSVLTGGRRRTARHNTLRACIAWSYELLSPVERTLLQTLSVFAGGFTVAAAEGVGADDDIPAEAVAGVLTDLVDRSLVVVEHTSAGTRYRLLDTIRVFAAEMLLTAGGEGRVRDRHLAWYAHWSYEEAVSTKNWSVSPLVSTRCEVDNQRRAAQWALRRQDPHALAQLLVDAVGGFVTELTEARYYIEALTSYDAVLDAVDRDRLAYCQAALAMFAGEFAEAMRICEVQREIAVDRFMWDKFTFLLAFNSAWVAPARASVLYDELEQRAGASVMVAYGRATVALTNRRYGDAVDMLLATLGIEDVRRLEAAEGLRIHRDRVGFVLQDLATGLHLCGRNDEADVVLEFDSGAEFEFLKHYPLVLGAAIRASQGDQERARHLLALSLAAVRRAAIPLGTSDCAIGAAAVAYWSGDLRVTSNTLAAVRGVGGFRTEASFALYRGYVDRVKQALGDAARPSTTVPPINEALDGALNTLGVSPR